MLLTIDIGNTHTSLGLYEGEKLQFVARIASDTKRTAEQYALEIRSIFVLRGYGTSQLTGAIISSVVPGLSGAVRDAVSMLSSIKPLLLGPGVKSGLNITIDNPAQLGGDLVAGAVAAIHLYKPPVIILDLGTATKISAVDQKGAYLGCAICAGVSISLDALATRTAQLPYVSIEAPRHAIGTNSVMSMQSGLVLGTAAMIDGIIDRFEKEMGGSAAIIATGGLAEEIINHMQHGVTLNKFLTLEGLRIIYQKNKSKMTTCR